MLSKLLFVLFLCFVLADNIETTRNTKNNETNIHMLTNSEATYALIMFFLCMFTLFSLLFGLTACMLYIIMWYDNPCRYHRSKKINETRRVDLNHIVVQKIE